MEKEAFKIRKDLIGKIKQLKEKDGAPITWHIEKAVENYLKRK